MSVTYRFFGAFRLLLALMVVVQHALSAFGSRELQDLLAPLEIGSTAVLLFFVLSGFIVVEAAMLFYEGRPAAFLTNRLIRIYPPYAVAVLLTVLVTFLVARSGGEAAVVKLFGGWPDHSAGNILASLVGIIPLAGKLVAPSGSEPILTLAWALRIELVFYSVVGLALAAGQALKQSAARLLGVAAVVLLAAELLWFNSLRGKGLEFTPYFVLGASIYFSVTPARARRRWLSATLALISCVLIAMHIGGQDVENANAHFQRDVTGQLMLFFSGLACCLALLALPRHWPAWFKCLQAMDQKTGDLTYAVYLTHIAALLFVLSLFPDGGLLGLTVALGCAVIFAVLMVFFVERPLQSLRSGIRTRQRGATPATVFAR